MPAVDILPIVFVGGVFLYIAWKMTSEFISTRRSV